MVRGMVMKIRATLEIPDRSITRAKLEYPTENVSFAYLASIDKVGVSPISTDRTCNGFLTLDSFADKAVTALIWDRAGTIFGRYINNSNWYRILLDNARATTDFTLGKYVGGTWTAITSEAVDISANYGYILKLSISGSTLKGFRGEPTTPAVEATTLKFTATDTSHIAGSFGPGSTPNLAGLAYPDVAWLRAPASPAPPAQAILELGVEGSGATEDPYRPSLSQNLAEISQLTGLPSFLYQEARKYEILKNKGFTEDEIKLLLGYIPKHQVDLNSVTWGAFEFSEKSPTNIIIIIGDNPYQQGAIQKHIELVRSKNMRVLGQPRNYGEAVAQYNQLKRDYPHWLAGKDNYAYQVLGLEELDLFQNVDFYHGELVEHRTHYQQLKQVPEAELWRRLEELERRLEKVEVLTEERDKHISKVKEVKRLGW
jgi:hypothetical protein